MSSPPPLPLHILRTHRHPISALHISPDNERIYSADASGLVAVTSTRSLRCIARWQAHGDSVLGVQEWGGSIITQARDNKMHVWTLVRADAPSLSIGTSAAASLDLPTPHLRESADVNALNFCRFSLLPLGGDHSAERLRPLAGESTAEHDENGRCLIAIPNLIQSEYADIWVIPGFERLHAAIGSSDMDAGRGTNKSTGIIMSLHLYTSPSLSPSPSPSSSSTAAAADTPELRLLAAYENGSLRLRRYIPPSLSDLQSGRRSYKYRSVEGKGWETMWCWKVHNESVMGMSVSLDTSLCLTVSADHLISRYDLSHPSVSDECASTHRTKHPGNSAIMIHDEGRVCAVGGWDGKIRLYSTKSLKPLGTLIYHKENCQTLAFAHPLHPMGLQQDKPHDSFRLSEDPEQSIDDQSDEEEEELSEGERVKRSRWLVAGSKDGRVSIWELKDFTRGSGGVS